VNPSPRPDPDALLASLKRNEERGTRGRLKVFLGMCPGVGKTYAMLSAARQALRERVDVVVGVVETHGRAETLALLEGLPVVPRKEISYKGISIGEMDLEAILARKPKLVLVDELAHTNAPGSRHPKRHQDVVELVNAGIDVMTTLNVQHIESRADAVAQITGAPIAETVPDSLLGQADEIELVDLTPEKLLERLSQGKVYLGERAEAAAANFFQETNITALRELALRFTAERMDERLRVMRAGGQAGTVWRSGQRLVVAVGPSPSSTQLVRWTRRMAAAQGADWLAVNVESSRTLSAADRQRLDRNLSLARELGAEVVVTRGEDAAEALIRAALQNKATQVVVGKSRNPRWLDVLRGGSLLDRLLKAPEELDICVVPPERAGRRPATFWSFRSRTGGGEYLKAMATVLAVTVLGLLLLPHVGYLAIGMLYLMTVVALGLKVGRGPVLMAGIVSALAWDYMFIPPIFTFVITKFEDGVLFAAYFVVSLVTGQLTARIRAQERHERAREARATALFHLTRALSAAKTLDEGVFAALRQADELFGAQTALLVQDEEGTSLVPHFAGSFMLDEKERSVAEWVWRNRRPAGRFTDTLPSSSAFHVPLVREDKGLGTLAIRLKPEAELSLSQRDLAEAFGAQIALLVERETLRAAGERERILEESERLHRTLLDGVSHELKTPLAVVASVAENLDGAPAGLRASLLAELKTATRRLNRLVNNLLDQTRLESGTLKPKMDWCDARDLVNAAVDGVSDALEGHPVDVLIPQDMPLFRADAALMEQVIANLLSNAARHTPKGTQIFLAAGRDGARNSVFLTVADRGPGFPMEMRERLFQKFQRGDAARTGGLGLGLSIVRGFVTAQGGEVVVGANPGGGAVFTVYLPHEPHAEVPNE
jgi:two-component system, OmpR family, sensor histidine kinase KdpD